MKMTQKVPVILCDANTAPAFSIFNPNDWNGESKAIIQSCAAHYGLLLYIAKKLKDIVAKADILCSPKFDELKAQWSMSKWDITKSTYWVDIPELHLSIHSFLSTVKTLLDVIAQLISSEGIVTAKIHGFHEKGDKLLRLLENNTPASKQEVASLLRELISRNKGIWIDNVVDFRDFFIHPERGLSTVMFALELSESEGELQLTNILKPSFDNEEFHVYADKVLLQVKEFSTEYMEYIKSV